MCWVAVGVSGYNVIEYFFEIIINFMSVIAQAIKRLGNFHGEEKNGLAFSMFVFFMGFSLISGRYEMNSVVRDKSRKD